MYNLLYMKRNMDSRHEGVLDAITELWEKLQALDQLSESECHELRTKIKNMLSIIKSRKQVQNINDLIDSLENKIAGLTVLETSSYDVIVDKLIEINDVLSYKKIRFDQIGADFQEVTRDKA